MTVTFIPQPYNLYGTITSAYVEKVEGGASKRCSYIRSALEVVTTKNTTFKQTVLVLTLERLEECRILFLFCSEGYFWIRG